MSDQARILSLEQVEPGMVLGDALLDGQGRALLPAGTVLTDAHLAALRRREVPTVSVLASGDAPEPMDEATRQAILDRLDRLFSHAGREEADRLLREAVTRYRLERPT